MLNVDRPEPKSNRVAGSGTVVVLPLIVPSTTRLSIRLVPVADVAPLNTMRNAELGLSLSPARVLKSKTTGVDPKAAAGA
jgi:hypothetical protein